MKLIKTVLCMAISLIAQFAVGQDTWIGTSTTTNGKIGLARSGTVKWNIFNDTNDDFFINTTNGGQSNIIMNANGFLEFRSQTHTVLNIASLGTGVNPYLRFSSNGSLKWSFYNDYNTNDFFFATSAGGAGNVRMLIKQNGNVGIGSTDPQAKIHIHALDSRALRFGRDNSNSFGFEIGGSSFGLYDYTTNKYQWRTNAGNLYLVEDGGNVGIGTTSPDAALTVKGDIHTREVRVDMTGPLAPPDYVFEKDYNLLPLSEVEAYINENKHLPEVPSAKEMEANGLNLKEMNLLLLKKVEELTLHLIDANKKIESLDQEVQSLKKSGTR